MIKRINSLGRKRIARDCVAISVQDGQPRRFSASIELEETGWPHDAIVVMEATCAGSPIVKRFSCGTVGSLSMPLGIPLDGITGKNVFFSIKIIDRSEKIGRLLGVAENVRPSETGKQTESGRRGILPVELVPLGQRLWQLDFRDHDVFLLVNDSVDGLSERMRSDPMFYSLVYPEIIRQILSKAIDQNIDIEESDDRWPYLWLAFAMNLHPENEKPPSSDDEDTREDWIEQVVAGFCKTHLLRDKYVLAASRLDSSGE